MRKKILVSCLIAAAAARLEAMEIPLEGFGKAAVVAYVNMHKVFEAFPETEKARADLNLIIAEKQQDITAKKEEISTLKAQIDFLKKQMGAVNPSTAPKAISESPKPALAPDSVTSLTSLTLPEGSPLKFLFSPPAESTSTAQDPNKVSYSTFAASAPQILPGIPSPGPSLMGKEAELSKKESELEVFIGLAEQEIRNMEEGKSMTVMARIYRTLEDISNRQGYSVVLDKSDILYGESAIDITDQLIQKLNAPRFGSER